MSARTEIVPPWWWWEKQTFYKNFENGERWIHIPFVLIQAAGGKETRSLQLYRLSDSVCILEPRWLQHSCQVSRRANDPNSHLLTVLLHPRYSGGRRCLCEQNISQISNEYFSNESGDWIGLGYFLLSRSDLHKTLLSAEASRTRGSFLGSESMMPDCLPD